MNLLALINSQCKFIFNQIIGQGKKLMVDISVIIVSWNAKELLYECLLNLTKEKNHYQLEIIVVDNASTDGAPELVREKFPHVRLLRNDENLGFSKANNIGIKVSKGRYICLINSDAFPLDGCLDRLCKHMDEHKEIGVIGPKVLNPDGTLQPSCREFNTLWKNFCRALALDKIYPKSNLFCGYFMTNWSHDTIREVDYISGCFMMVRTSAIKKVGLLDEEFFFYAEDKDWCKRFWDMDYKVLYFPDAEAIHILYGSTKDIVKFYIQEVKSNLKYYKKHHTQIELIGYIAIAYIHQIVRVLGSVISCIIKPSQKEASLLNIKRSIACLLWLYCNRKNNYI